MGAAIPDTAEGLPRLQAGELAMTRYKLRPPARGANEPSYPHLDLSNLPPKPGPSRVERQIREEWWIAYSHYGYVYRGGGRMVVRHRSPVDRCSECGSVILTLTWGMSAAWFKAPAIPRGFR
jgi:hypothetical protein